VAVAFLCHVQIFLLTYLLTYLLAYLLTIAAYRQIHSRGLLVWSEVQQLLDAELHSSDEAGETLSMTYY